MQVSYHSRTVETDSITTFFFKPEKPLSFTAGQFVELKLPHDNPDNRGIKRWFTLSSSPSNEQISITTRFTEQDGSSYKHALQALTPGDELTISQPMGDFVLPQQADIPLIFVAGGIGLTPFLSILRWLSDVEQKRNITLIQAVRTEDDIAFQDVFEAVNQHVTIVVSNPSAAWGGERGRLSAQLIEGLGKPSSESMIYISGPEGMVENLVKDLSDHGIKQHQLIGDYFPNYPTE